MKIYIKAMSTNKKKIEYQLFVSAEKMVEHLVKLIEFPDACAKNHWAQEVHAFLHSVPRLKGSNKLPTSKFIYNQISSYNDILDSVISYAVDTEPDEAFHDVSAFDCLKYVEEYEHWLADNLSTSGHVTQAQVVQKLKDLGLL